VASSVQGLKPQNISIVDIEGRLLSNPFAGDELAMTSSTNMELKMNVERSLEIKTSQMLATVFGHAKSQVKVAADLDFDKVERTVRSFDPESRVIRSENRSEEVTKNAPDGDHNRESSTTNYEIDETVERTVQQVGALRRLTVSVVIDGRYELVNEGRDGRRRVFIDRTPDELQKIEDLVKNAVGYDLSRGDQIVVASLQFDNSFLDDEQERFLREEARANRMLIIKIVLAVFVGIVFLLLIRSIAKTVTEAMNPPVPELQELGLEITEEEELSEDRARAQELLEKVEVMTNMTPINTAAIIRQWLTQSAPPGAKKK
jgi:flagellar M-ring protein FliF